MNSILDTLIAELQARKGSWRRLSAASGVPYDTITKIAQGRTDDPRIRTVEKLRASLRLADRHPT